MFYWISLARVLDNRLGDEYLQTRQISCRSYQLRSFRFDGFNFIHGCVEQIITEVRNQEALEPYQQQALLLAQAAGLEIIGSGEIKLMESDRDHFPALTLGKPDFKAASNKRW
jgi:hypothetical protein